MLRPIQSLEISNKKVHLEIDLKNLKENQKSFNYVVEIQKLVAEILNELGRISANDHESIEKMKNKYCEASIKHAKLMGDYGQVNRNMSIACFAIFSVQFFMMNIDDKKMIELISNQIPNLGAMSTARIQAEMHEKSSESQLELEKYRTKTAAKQSDGSAKQDYMALLQSVGDNLKSASRGG